jgi:CHASE1-domain containing sensor protein
LPEPEIFVATLDNDQSYIYDRQIGFLRRGNVELETAARQVAEDEIGRAAINDGILEQAEQNAKQFLLRLFVQLGFPDVVFVDSD